jgi:hypothetical protein
VTRVEFLELRPSQPEYYLAMQDNNGILDMRQPLMPESWARLSANAETINLSALPKLLCGSGRRLTDTASGASPP